MQQCFSQIGSKHSAIPVRSLNDLETIDGLIIPGGESTTISRNLQHLHLFKPLVNRIQHDHLPVMGTCAGCVLLAKTIDPESKPVKTLAVMDMEVKRNAYGPQRHSFEHDVSITGFSPLFHAVFIRAPRITKVGNACKILATFNDTIIMAQQGNLLALCFHPELTKDYRIHTYFIEMITK